MVTVTRLEQPGFEASPEGVAHGQFLFQLLDLAFILLDEQRWVAALVQADVSDQRPHLCVFGVCGAGSNKHVWAQQTGPGVSVSATAAHSVSTENYA